MNYKMSAHQKHHFESTAKLRYHHPPPLVFWSKYAQKKYKLSPIPNRERHDGILSSSFYIWCSKNQIRIPSFLSHIIGKQIWIQTFQRNRTAPRVVPDSNTNTLSYRIHHMTKETLFSFPNFLPCPTTMCLSDSSSAPISSSLPIFGGYNLTP